MNTQMHNATVIEATRFSAFLDTVMVFTGKRLTPDLVDEISGALQDMVNKSSYSWSFGGSPEELSELLACSQKARKEDNGTPSGLESD